jgi:uncharacterized cupin superfamily protein
LTAVPRVVDLKSGAWQEHARFPGIFMQTLLGTADNPLASINALRVPPGRAIGAHRHAQQVETVWVISGHPILAFGPAELALAAGQIVAIPAGLEHALRNEGPAPVELLTFFTPPLA